MLRNSRAMWLAAFVATASCAVAQDDPQVRLQNAWEGCLLQYADRAARATSENADTISRAAFSSCRSDENQYYRFLTQGRDPVVAQMAEEILFPAVKQHYADMVLDAILSARM